MKKILFSLCFLLPRILFGQGIDRSVIPSAGPAPTINIKDSEVFKTSNGITVIVSENHKFPKVSFRFVMGASPMTQGTKAGLADISGELILSGTSTRTKDQLDGEVDYIGASLRADKQSISLSCLTKHLPKGLTILSDILVNANFPADEFERVKKQSYSALLSAKSDPGTMSDNAEAKANFPKGHPYSEVMTEASLNNIRVEDVKEYFKQIFTPDSSFVVIVGDITVADAKEMIEKYFANWTGGKKYDQEIGAANFHKGNRVIFVKKPGAVQSSVSISFPLGIKPGDQDQIPLTVMNGILGGGGFGTRLMANLREDKAYTYGCNSSLNITEDGSWLSASGNFRNEVTDSAITEILFELDQLSNGYVLDDELNLTKQTMAGSFARSLESPQTVARFALSIIKNKLSKDYYQTYLKKLEAVNKEDVLTMAQKYLTAKNCNIVVVGNEEILALLKKFDSDGKIEIFDAYGEEVKELKKATISKEELVEKYILATTQSSSLKQALKKIGKIKSLEEVSELTMAQIPFPLKSTKTWSKPQKEGQKLEGQGMVFQRSFFDGTVGIMHSMQTGKKDLTPEEITAKSKSTGLFPELNYNKTGIQFELLGIETIEEKNFFVLKTNDGMTESFDYYDCTTFLKKKSLKIEKEAGEISESEITYSNYKDINGILFPQLFVLASGEAVFNGKVISTNVNGKVDFQPYM
jgi:zinc protease